MSRMHRAARISFRLTLFAFLALTTSCRGDFSGFRPEGYSPESHSQNASPDYDLLFTTERVHRIDIEIDADAFEELRTNLNIAIHAGRTPIFGDVTIRFDDRTWEHVGMRFKALNSAENAIEAGSEKFSFKLSFDEHEIEYPGTKNQRFYGFKKLDFNANHKDDSFLREVLASEIFRAGGVPTARAAFSRVYVDVGDGPVYWGLYTMLEDTDDAPMLETQLGGRGGNLYEPEGPGADWTSFVESSFVKKTNQTAADYSDVRAAVEALNDSSQSGKSWREALEERFDVDGFLDFLALNTAMVNGDAYGCAAENYYLYGVAADGGRLKFIPTDLNETMRGTTVSCGSVSVAAPQDTPSDLFFGNLGETMPLITRVLKEEPYLESYRRHLKEALEGPFSLEEFSARALALHELIAPFVIGSKGETRRYTNLSSEAAFEQSVSGDNGLIAHVQSRHELVNLALEETP